MYFNDEAQKVETQQVAQFVAKPIEIVEYQRFHNQCSHCREVCVAPWSDSIIPGQDLGLSLQALRRPRTKELRIY